MIDLLGWAATGVFVTSYFCKRAEVLRRAQMVGAAMWIGYGVLMQAAPVVAANVLVVLAIAWTTARSSAVGCEREVAPRTLNLIRAKPWANR